MSTKRRKFSFYIDENRCFVCTSHKRWKGHYPQCNWNGKTANIHKIIFVECFGDVPKGMDIRHTCDNKGCINPEHMILGSRQDNVNDAIERGLWPFGEKSGNSKLDSNKVKHIRLCLSKGKDINKKVISLAEKYGVSTSTIYSVYYKRSWNHVRCD